MTESKGNKGPPQLDDPKWATCVALIRASLSVEGSTRRYAKAVDVRHGLSGRESFRRISGGGHEVWTKEEMEMLREWNAFSSELMDEALSEIPPRCHIHTFLTLKEYIRENE